MSCPSKVWGRREAIIEPLDDGSVGGRRFSGLQRHLEKNSVELPRKEPKTTHVGFRTDAMFGQLPASKNIRGGDGSSVPAEIRMNLAGHVVGSPALSDKPSEPGSRVALLSKG